MLFPVPCCKGRDDAPAQAMAVNLNPDTAALSSHHAKPVMAAGALDRQLLNSGLIS
jgi:hypothetical protein